MMACRPPEILAVLTTGCNTRKLALLPPNHARVSVFSLILALVAALVVQAAGAAGQDGLVRAKELYSLAAYEDALAMLDGLQERTAATSVMEVAQYRAFCLVALQRLDEAKKVMEGMVSADPFYRISGEQTSPRVRSLFQDVRRSVLPAVVQRFYAEAKDSLGRRDPGASAQFDRVLALIDDPDMRGLSAGDFRTIVVGFRDLSRAVTASITASAPAAPVAPPVVPRPADAIAPGGNVGGSVNTSTSPGPPPSAVPRRQDPAGQSTPFLQIPAEEAAVAAVLRAYEEAYSTLDIDAVIKVYPRVAAAPLAQGFAQMKAQRVQILVDQLSVSGTTATVTCQVRQRFEPKAGRANEATVNATFRLQKSGGVWVIVDRR
jgi:ketosteroid isomerase-like protein